MKITKVIEMLEQEKEKHGDIEVFVDLDYGQREVKKDDDPLCLSPLYEKAVNGMPERIVI